MTEPHLRPDTWERMIRAVERVEQRLVRATTALSSNGIQFVVVGGVAVARWVRTADDGADRHTPNVDLMVRRCDLERATNVLQTAGFVPVEIRRLPTLIDGAKGSVRSGLHLLCENERVAPTDLEPNPPLSQPVSLSGTHVLALEPLVRMKLVAHRTIDWVHLRDLIGIGLIDDTWPDRFPAELADRLRAILANPDG